MTLRVWLGHRLCTTFWSKVIWQNMEGFWWDEEPPIVNILAQFRVLALQSSSVIQSQKEPMKGDRQMGRGERRWCQKSRITAVEGGQEEGWAAGTGQLKSGCPYERGQQWAEAEGRREVEISHRGHGTKVEMGGWFRSFMIISNYLLQKREWWEWREYGNWKKYKQRKHSGRPKWSPQGCVGQVGSRTAVTGPRQDEKEHKDSWARGTTFPDKGEREQQASISSILMLIYT